MKRIWLIGNGISLNETPLDLLKNEDTMGMNRNHKLDFHPKMYFCIDIADGDIQWRDAVEFNQCAKLFLWDGLGYEGAFTPIKRCKAHHFYASDNTDKRVQSWHLPELCTAVGSMSTMMQLSVILGYEEIYLVGCDLWKEGQNHYTKEYVSREDIEVRNRDALYLHTMAKQSCPIPIYNCTIGGGLEIHPRKDIRKVLQ